MDMIDLAHVSFASGELKSMDPQRLAAHRAALSARRTSVKHCSESFQTEEASRRISLWAFKSYYGMQYYSIYNLSCVYPVSMLYVCNLLDGVMCFVVIQRAALADVAAPGRTGVC